MQITLSGHLAGRHDLVKALEDFCRDHSVTSEVKNAIDVALEEYLTNVSIHGGAREVAVKWLLAGNRLVIEVEDDGKSYDPCKHPKVDTTRPLAEMPIGGLGIHLIRQFMDELSYSGDGRKNVLRMTKRLVESAA